MVENYRMCDGAVAIGIGSDLIVAVANDSYITQSATKHIAFFWQWTAIPAAEAHSHGLVYKMRTSVRCRDF